MENNRFPCRDTKTSRRAWIRVRPSQDHRFSPFLASVTKALAQNAQALLSSLFPWLVSVSTRKSPAVEPFVSPLARPAASRVRSEKKQCLHMWTEKMLQCGKELPESQRRLAESQLSSPGAAETDSYTGGHHCPLSTRVASFLPYVASPCGQSGMPRSGVVSSAPFSYAAPSPCQLSASPSLGQSGRAWLLANKSWERCKNDRTTGLQLPDCGCKFRSKAMNLSPTVPGREGRGE